jgi:hypothetical protein
MYIMCPFLIKQGAMCGELRHTFVSVQAAWHALPARLSAPAPRAGDVGDWIRDIGVSLVSQNSGFL